MKGKKSGKRKTNKKTALTRTVKSVVNQTLDRKRCVKVFTMHQTTGDLNNPNNAHRWNEDIGRIPKYDPLIVSGQAGNLSQARISNKIRLEKIRMTFGFLNTGSYNNCVRIILFRNTNDNEIYNTNGSNLCMGNYGQPISFSTDLVIGQMQSFNYNLVKHKSDLIFDKTYQIPYDHAPSTYTIMNRRVFTITKTINRDMEYEARPDLANALDNKGPKYYLVWHILTLGTTNVSPIEGDLFLDQCYSEDA